MISWKDIVGTTAAYFRIGLAGVRLKNVGGNLVLRNAVDGADAELTASKANITGNDIAIGTTNVLTVSKNAAQSGALQVIWPSGKATDGQVLAQKAGTAANIIEFEFVSATNTGSANKDDTTTLVFNSSTPTALFSTGAADIIKQIQVVVDTAFNGTGPTPSMSVGIAGTVSKYLASSQVDLTTVGVYEVNPGLVAQGAEALIATFTAGGGASAGSARILVTYNTPT